MMEDIKTWWTDMDSVTKRKLKKLSKLCTIIAVIVLAPTLIINLLALVITGAIVAVLASPVILIVAGLCGLAALIWKLL